MNSQVKITGGMKTIIGLILVCGLFVVPKAGAQEQTGGIFLNPDIDWKLLTISPTFHFGDDGKGNSVGILTWDNGYLEFTGDADASAKNFFEGYLKDLVDEYIAANCPKESKKDEKTGTSTMSMTTGELVFHDPESLTKIAEIQNLKEDIQKYKRQLEILKTMRAAFKKN